MAILLVGGTGLARGQSALDGFDPNANGLISVLVVQPDGKILIGGDFTTLAPNGGAPVTRNRIARLNSDGSLDTNFNPNANGVVSAIAVQADGKILVGGEFNGANSIGGQARNRIARLDAVTGVADSFNPDPSTFGFPTPNVYAIVVQTDGKILVGGGFGNIGGQARNRIARLDPTTGLADSFNPNADGFGGVQEIAVQTDGKIVVGGGFTTIGGQSRNNIARLDPATGAADSWNPNADNTVHAMALQPDGRVLIGGDFASVGGMTTFMARLDPVTGAPEAAFNPGSNERVLSIIVQSDGKILAGGIFTTIGGQARNRIARLDPTTGAADAFNPNANFFVRAIAAQPDGKVLVGGEFNNMGGQTRNNIARLETDGRLDRTLDLSVSGNVGSGIHAIAIQPDGKILIGGVFTTVLGITRNNIARLNTDGTLDTTFNPNATGSGSDSIHSIALQRDGKILVGGAFASIGGQTRKSIARLDVTTGLADSFDPNPIGPAIIPSIYSIVVQPDGKILVGGFFDIIGGQTRNNIARLDATTGMADSFNPSSGDGGLVYSIAVQADGKILVGGTFGSIGGQSRDRIARLDASTGAADSFNPDASTSVYAIVVQTNGKILVGGDFNSIGGQTRNCIARLDATTGLADSFSPNANGTVYTIAVQADGKILVGGFFTEFGSFGAQPRNRIARLDATTGLADSFNPNASFTVNAIAVQADGKILAGGLFNNIDGQARNFFARLSNDTAALHNLTVSQSNVTWTRSGSSPQLTRVTFEYSTNNVNYTTLGNGAAIGSNWTLTGLNLPAGQNIYLRARGFYSGGRYNGSESITESVRNAFLPALPPLLNIQRSANMNVVLSWATNFTGFTLESKTNLNTNVWSVVTPAPVVSGTNNAVTNAVSGAARFYRLRQ